MRRCFAFVSALLLFGVPPVLGQSVSRAYCGKDKKAHVVYANGVVTTVAPQQKQVGCGGISVAEDKRTVGWSVLVENCCTSYPIPTAVALYRNGKKTLIPSDQMIWQWHFLDRGNRVAVLSGPVHGSPAKAVLYDAHDGKVLTSRNGEGPAPAWAEIWQKEFELRGGP
jgi:hypothetical protein